MEHNLIGMVVCLVLAAIWIVCKQRDDDGPGGGYPTL
jgi:hypothetical protein